MAEPVQARPSGALRKGCLVLDAGQPGRGVVGVVRPFHGRGQAGGAEYVDAACCIRELARGTPMPVERDSVAPR